MDYFDYMDIDDIEDSSNEIDENDELPDVFDANYISNFSFSKHDFVVDDTNDDINITECLDFFSVLTQNSLSVFHKAGVDPELFSYINYVSNYVSSYENKIITNVESFSDILEFREFTDYEKTIKNLFIDDRYNDRLFRVVFDYSFVIYVLAKDFSFIVNANSCDRKLFKICNPCPSDFFRTSVSKTILNRLRSYFNDDKPICDVSLIFSIKYGILKYNDYFELDRYMEKFIFNI